MERMPKMAPGKVSLASGIYCRPSFLFLLPYQRLHVMNNMCTHTHVCVELVYELPLLPNASETFLQKSSVVRSVDWVFIIGAPA
jgi:hypothetical protein